MAAKPLEIQFPRGQPRGWAKLNTPVSRAKIAHGTPT